MTILHALVESNPHLAKSTAKKYLNSLDGFISFVGDQPLTWTPQNFEAYYSQLIQSQSTTSANQGVVAIKFASKWFARLKLDPKLDFAANEKILTAENIQVINAGILSAAPVDLRDKALLLTCRDVGVRAASRWIIGEGNEQLANDTLKVVSTWKLWLNGHTKKGHLLFRSLKWRVANAKTHSVARWQTGMSLSEQAIRATLSTRVKEAGYEDIQLDFPIEPKWLTKFRKKQNVDRSIISGC